MPSSALTASQAWQNESSWERALRYDEATRRLSGTSAGTSTDDTGAQQQQQQQQKQQQQQGQFLPNDADDSKDTTWMGFCRLPPWDPQASGVNRRLDLKFYSAAHFPFALLYFTGSDHFNRSMRFFANRMGWSLSDSGLRPTLRVRKDAVAKGKSIFVRCEQDVFVALGLRYVPPEKRNTYENWELGNVTAASPGPDGAGAAAEADGVAEASAGEKPDDDEVMAARCALNTIEERSGLPN
jgi:hypothetical protein